MSGGGGPLQGVRILAVEQMQALPFATQLLARLGADVVKVEHPERGDLGRSSTPSMPDPQGRPVGATFLRNNMGKRSITLDLKRPGSTELFLELCGRFDVVAENLRPGAMGRYGLDYAAVRAVHPEVIYVSVSGFGNTTDSPYREWPAFAPIAEAMAGLYTLTRPAAEPIRVSAMGGLGDTCTGLFAAVGLLSALHRRQHTGEGAYLDVAMLDCMVAYGDLIPNFWSLGKDPRSPHELINHGFRLAGGEIIIQVGREHQFARLCELLDKQEWLDDTRFATREGWVANIDVIGDAVRSWAGERSPVEVAGVLAAAGIAAGPVYEAADVIADPHVAGRAMLTSIPRPDGGSPVLVPASPIRFVGDEPVTERRPPWLGEHTADVLAAELGEDRAARARRDGLTGEGDGLP